MKEIKWAVIGMCVVLMGVSLFASAGGTGKESSVGPKPANAQVEDALAIEITKPARGHLYFYEREVLPLGVLTLVIGPITVETQIESDNPVDRVEFYVDDSLQHTDYREPCTWKNMEQARFRHVIKVKAYDTEGNEAEREMPIWVFSRGADIAPPEVWITSPSPTVQCHEPSWDVALVSGDTVMISAAQVNGSREIAYTLFEYSSDGVEWTPIGVDSYGDFEGHVFEAADEEPWYGGNRKLGEEGWHAGWDVSGIAEGTYYIRATMEDDAGSRGSCVREIVIDRTPPKPAIECPCFGETVSGTIQFKASCKAPNVVKMEVKLFHGSPTWYNQTGLGNARQNPGDGGICAPTAAANALAGLGDDKVYPPGKEGNDSALQEELVDEMGTDKEKGTNCWGPLAGPLINNAHCTDSMGDAIKSYLEKRGIGCSNESGYDVTVYRVTVDEQNGRWGVVPGSNEITFKEYSKQIRLNQRVILAWSDWEVKETTSTRLKGHRITFPKEGGSHAVTGRGARSEPYAGQDQASVMDTNGENKTISWVNQTDYGGGNVSMIKVDGEWKILIGMWVICPKSNAAYCSSCGIDTNPEDGFVVAYDTTGLGEDGTYTFIIEMTDAAGFMGQDAIVVAVDNIPEDTEPPMVEITDPEDNVEVSAPHVNVTGDATDAGSDIIRMDYLWEWEDGSTEDNKSYDPPRSGISFRIEIFDLREGWNSVTVGAEDAAGDYGTDMVNIFYVPDGEDTTPPVTTKEVGQPSWEDGYVIAPYTPIWLHATDDQSGVAYIYYEIAWDSNEDGVWDETFQETVHADMVEIHVEDRGILNGIIELRWYAADNAGNKEEMHYQEHYVTTE